MNKTYEFKDAAFGLVVNHWLEKNGHVVADEDAQHRMVHECVSQYKAIQDVFAMAKISILEENQRVLDSRKDEPKVNKPVEFKF